MRGFATGPDGFREQGSIPLIGLFMSGTLDGLSSLPV